MRLVLRYGSYASSEKTSAAVVVPSETISPVAAAVRWVAVIAEVRRKAAILMVQDVGGLSCQYFCPPYIPPVYHSSFFSRWVVEIE
jgi:hypothetical protein